MFQYFPQFPSLFLIAFQWVCSTPTDAVIIEFACCTTSVTIVLIAWLAMLNLLSAMAAPLLSLILLRN